MYDHLASVERQTKKEIPELHMDCPEGWEYLAGYFYQLHLGRGVSSGGPQALNYTDIMNWRILFQVELMLCELHILKKMDEIFLSISADELSKAIK